MFGCPQAELLEHSVAILEQMLFADWFFADEVY
jgi:hypothetical protein